MRVLLDTRVLIALLDENHLFHTRAHDWFEQNVADGWASCPITENGAVRILTGAGYRVREPIVPAEAIKALRDFAQRTSHEFWPEAISIRESDIFVADRIHSANQITDLYLLALAIKNGGRLATLDSRITLNAVSGATPAHLELIT